MTYTQRDKLFAATIMGLVFISFWLVILSVAQVAGQEGFTSDPGVATVYRCSNPYSYAKADVNQDGSHTITCDEDWQSVSWPTGIWPSDGWRVGGWVLDPNEVVTYDCNGTVLMRLNMDDTIGTMETIFYCHQDTPVYAPPNEVTVFTCPDGEFAEVDLDDWTVICQLDDLTWQTHNGIPSTYTVDYIDTETLAVQYTCEDGIKSVQYHQDGETEQRETRVFCNEIASRLFLPVAATD